MPNATPYGEQQIEQLLKDRRVSVAEFVRSTKIPGKHVFHAIKGVTPPSVELRAIAPLLLGVPLEELFTSEVLAVEKQPSRRKGPQPPCSICGKRLHTLEESRRCFDARRAAGGDVHEPEGAGRERVVTS